jgi:hypothetical protein
VEFPPKFISWRWYKVITSFCPSQSMLLLQSFICSHMVIPFAKNMMEDFRVMGRIYEYQS